MHLKINYYFKIANILDNVILFSSLFHNKNYTSSFIFNFLSEIPYKTFSAKKEACEHFFQGFRRSRIDELCGFTFPQETHKLRH